MRPQLVKKDRRKRSREELLLAEFRALRTRFEYIEALIESLLQPPAAA